MSDDLIRGLQRDWQSQEIDATSGLRRLQRTRWVPHLVLGLEIVGCCFALGVGVWFAWVANHQAEHKLLYTLSAAILLITAPVLGWRPRSRAVRVWRGMTRRLNPSCASASGVPRPHFEPCA